jgi:hypothetical protein
VTEPSLAPFAWVYKRDGRLVPFEADKISRALFAASESLGRPDAFLARELTDGILHFLAADADGSTPTTAQIGDLVVKVIRELGQPALAAAFAEGNRKKDKGKRKEGLGVTEGVEGGAKEVRAASAFLFSLFPGEDPRALVRRAAGASLRDYSLREVFTRDLVAAQSDGLLTLTGLEAPLELAGCVLAPAPTGGVVEAVEEARGLAGGFLVVDGPEYVLAQQAPDGSDPGRAVADYVRELYIGLRATGLRAVVNLNSAAPPVWADDLAEGPLFAAHRQPAEPGRLAALVDALLEQLGPGGDGPGAVRVDWHLGERDFAPAAAGRLVWLARRAVDGAALAFTFDRPRRPVPLAEGLDRQHPAVLLAVGLHLPRLAEQPGLAADPARLLPKLGSLARLALSAAAQKRDFLRRHGGRPALTRGFLLDRARLVVAPVGLEAAAVTLVGRGLCPGGAGADFARRVVERLGEVLRQDGPARRLETCLDSAAAFSFDPPAAGARAAHGLQEPTQVAGLTAWDATAKLKHQVRAAGLLHTPAEMGTAAVLVPAEQPPSPEDVVELLHYAWQQTGVVRLRLVRLAPPQRQRTAPWEEDDGMTG